MKNLARKMELNSCNFEQVELLANDYVDGELDEELEQIFKEHLGRCQSCLQIVKELEDLKSLAAGLFDVSFPRLPKS